MNQPLRYLNDVRNYHGIGISCFKMLRPIPLENDPNDQ